MTCATYRGVFHSPAGDRASGQPNLATPRPGLLRRFVDAVRASRERRANRDIADFLARSGGRLTDGLEREMSERFLTGNRNFIR